MDTLRVMFDSPEAVYIPGQTVSGRILLELEKPIKARKVTVSFDGKAYTHWTRSETNYDRDINGESRRRTRTIDYQASVDYLKGEKILWYCEDGTDQLPAGQYDYPFSFTLNASCPPSFEGEHGYVRYKVRTEIDRPWRFDKSADKCFTVVPSIDLNLYPAVCRPAQDEDLRDTGAICCRRGTVSLSVQVPKTGFVAGESLYITIFVNNLSSREIDYVQAKLVQRTTYIARRSTLVFSTSSIFSDEEKKIDDKTVIEKKMELNAEPRTKANVVLDFKIPSVAPTFDMCPIIFVQYFFCRFEPSPAPCSVVPSELTPYPGNGAIPSAPPSYEECVYGEAGTTKDTDLIEPFVPRYPVFQRFGTAGNCHPFSAIKSHCEWRPFPSKHQTSLPGITEEMDSLRVVFDSPQAVFFPGQSVTGQVVMNTCQSMKARQLKVIVDGRAYTHWTRSESYSTTGSDGKSQTQTRSIPYSATVMYASGESILWTSGSGNTLLPGNYNFPFSFVLPLNCPPSYEGLYGYIRYRVKVELDRPWRFDKTANKCFSVIPTFDLNSIPQARFASITSDSKETGALFRRGRVSMNVQVPKTGFVPGEILRLYVSINNESSKPVTSLRAKLIQRTNYVAYRNSFGGHSTVHTIVKGSHEHRCEDKTVAKCELKINSSPKNAFQQAVDLRIPAVVPSFNVCPIISVDYELIVKVETSATFSSTLKAHQSILIGTVPIQQVTQLFSTVPPPAAAGYPVVNDNHDAPPPYPSSSSDGYPSAPPSYEESVYGIAGTTKDSEPFEPYAPRYPVYNNLPATQIDEKAPVVPSAPPL
ncbi:unnamed protein product [Caenorhabditis auriculariae]|uniref:Arrestin C-terminal-like domain-containing protein n=1 Tax=Caenorhabditis auriculariae TaxID=2777116 RepID=A0A8S1HXV5_9PELO|nr:unnamed protein product [Caenorhabditis auriculariae]